MRERIERAIAWMLPKEIAKWAFVRVAVNGTVGEYADQEVPALTVTEALKRW